MDERNFIEKQLDMGRELYGRELTPDEMAAEFAKGDVYKRADQLGTIKHELPDDMSPREAAKRFAQIRALDSMHQRLKEVDR